MTIDPNGKYVYAAPSTSPFYDKLLSPFCDWLCRTLVPIWVHPDQITVVGVFAASMAAFAVVSEWYATAGLLWMCYCLLDNMDGKQARRTKKSSPGGEFLDHSCDAVVVTLSFFIWSRAAFPGRLESWQPTFMLLNGQIPYFIGSWAHHSLGRLLLGSAVSTTDYFTVDEFNFLFLPSLCFIRALAPGLFDADAGAGIMKYTGISPPSLILDMFGGEDRVVTVGMMLGMVMSGFCVQAIFSVLFHTVTFKSVPLLLPVIAYPILVLYYGIPALMSLGPFALCNMECIANRLGYHSDTIAWVWWPLAILWVCGVLAPPGSPLHLPVVSGLLLLTAVCMHMYKLRVNSLVKKEKK